MKTLNYYIYKTFLPFQLLAVSLLTVLLLTQQSARILEFASIAEAPLNFINQATLALLPSVATLTIPVSLLVGLVLGLSKLAADSEIVAVAAAGIRPVRLLLPLLVWGLMLSGLTYYLNTELAPAGQRRLREIGVEAALQTLQSPIKPGTFTSEIPGYLIYVRSGNRQTGTWEKIFIETVQNKNRIIITARVGKIDAESEKSELLLNDATVTTFRNPDSAENGTQAFSTDRLREMRVNFNLSKKELLEKLAPAKPDFDELSSPDLMPYFDAPQIEERNLAQLLYHRRLALSALPLIFTILGATLGFKTKKGGKFAGVLISVAAIGGYFLLSLGFEQMGRRGTLAPPFAAWLTPAIVLIFSLIIGGFNRFGARLNINVFKQRLKIAPPVVATADPSRRGSLSAPGYSKFGGFPGKASFPALLDRWIWRDLLRYLLFTVGALVVIIQIFTLFEIWRFVPQDADGYKSLGIYLLYLIPLLIVQTLPGGMLVATIATVSILARRSEILAWLANGQSAYRILASILLFAALVTCADWYVQERIMPTANIRQDTLRARLKGQERLVTLNAEQWVALPNDANLYNYQPGNGDAISKFRIFRFDAEGVHLTEVTASENAKWLDDDRILVEEGTLTEFGTPKLQVIKLNNSTESMPNGRKILSPSVDRPTQMSSRRLKEFIKYSRLRGEKTESLTTALLSKYANLAAVFGMALLAAPLALAFGRRNVSTAIGAAIIIGVIFWIGGAFLQQLGTRGLIPPSVAAWAAVSLIYAAAIYFISIAKT